jgi:hypothetical protein
MSSTNNKEGDIKDEQVLIPINDTFINVLTDKIFNIIKSPDKNQFIKNYNESHNQIKKVDEILYKPSELDPELDIKILFEMLKQYDSILTTGDITIQEYKNMCDLVVLIDTKLKNMSLDIKEIQ